MIDEVDDTVQEKNVMADQNESILVFVQITLQPFDMLRIQIVIGRLVQEQDIRLLQQEFSQQDLGTLAASLQFGDITIETDLHQP